MKKLIIAALLLTASFTLGACGSDSYDVKGKWKCAASAEGLSIEMGMEFTDKQLIISIMGQNAPGVPYTASYSGKTVTLDIAGDKTPATFTDSNTLEMADPNQPSVKLVCKR